MEGDGEYINKLVQECLESLSLEIATNFQIFLPNSILNRDMFIDYIDVACLSILPSLPQLCSPRLSWSKWAYTADTCSSKL
jgi:hypothetical protein